MKDWFIRCILIFSIFCGLGLLWGKYKNLETRVVYVDIQPIYRNQILNYIRENQNKEIEDSKNLNKTELVKELSLHNQKSETSNNALSSQKDISVSAVKEIPKDKEDILDLLSESDTLFGNPQDIKESKKEFELSDSKSSISSRMLGFVNRMLDKVFSWFFNDSLKEEEKQSIQETLAKDLGKEDILSELENSNKKETENKENNLDEKILSSSNFLLEDIL